MILNKFEKFLRDEQVWNEESAAYYYENKLKHKVITALRIFQEIFHERVKALDCILTIPYRFQIAESFVTWQSCTSHPLSNIANIYSRSKMLKKSIISWRRLTKKKIIMKQKIQRAVEYHSHRKMLLVLANWAGYLSECYHNRANNRSYSYNPRKGYSMLKRRQDRSLVEGQINEKPHFRSFSILESTSFCTEMIVELDKMAKDYRNKILKKKTLEAWIKGLMRIDKAEKLKKKAANFKNSLYKRKFFKLWEKRYTVAAGLSILNVCLFKIQVKNSFINLRKWALKFNKNSKRAIKHNKENISIENYSEKMQLFHMDDYELALNIKMLEKKLTALNQELSIEQINHYKLLAEKREYIALF
ncbi:unnamed protein product [Blepharisma stoltei]|uniref:Uncharacterized protein n=1 Tax=Blepharisma stoltei TaxID=1481888 RepID=A0AAU9IRM7_9CILI|nr:unnamed protein product [Blepharisma stoltei]